MKQLKTLTTLLLLLCATLPFALVSCGDDDDDGTGSPSSSANANRNDTSLEPALGRLEFPKVKGGNSKIIIHTNNDQIGINYSVEWDADKKSQRWSCYQITAATSARKTSRYYSKDNQYPFDPDLSSSLYFSTDPFWGSGFDHGHICPSADRLYSEGANIQTFYLTNMQPQYNSFNAGIWAEMEAWVRNKVGTRSRDTLFVCKGGTIDKSDSYRTLSSGLIVPKYFYMALLLKKSADYSNIGAMAFYIEQKSVDDYNLTATGGYDLSSYVVNIRELEMLTGIDFFCNLPDNLEDQIETQSTSNIKRAWGL